MSKWIWCVAAVVAVSGVSYWTYRGDCGSCNPITLATCPTGTAPESDCSRCQQATCESTGDFADVIDLTSAYETQALEVEPPLAEFHPGRYLNNATDFAPCPFPLAREIAFMELIPLAEGEVADGPDLGIEKLPLPHLCETEPSTLTTVASGVLQGGVTIATAQRSTIIQAQGTEEASEPPLLEKLPMPKNFADPSKLGLPGKLPRIDTMEVRPTDVPGLSAYPYPY